MIPIVIAPLFAPETNIFTHYLIFKRIEKQRDILDLDDDRIQLFCYHFRLLGILV